MNKKLIAQHLLKMAKDLIANDPIIDDVKELLKRPLTRRFILLKKPENQEWLFEVGSGSADTMTEYFSNRSTAFVEYTCYSKGCKEAVGFKNVRIEFDVKGVALVPGSIIKT